MQQRPVYERVDAFDEDGKLVRVERHEVAVRMKGGVRELERRRRVTLARLATDDRVCDVRILPFAGGKPIRFNRDELVAYTEGVDRVES